MKTRLFFLFALLFSVSAIAQDTKTNIAVSYFDTKGISITTEQAGSIARSEITKMGKFEIMDEYDMISLLDKTRELLEELSPELGVTDPVSGTVIFES